MEFRLREGLSFCFTGGRAVFLDLPGDRYFCLAPELDTGFRKWVSGEADRNAVAALRAHRVLECGDTPSPPAPIHLTPATSSLLDCPRRAGYPASGAAWLHLALSAFRLRRSGLERTIDHLRERKGHLRRREAEGGQLARATRIAKAHEAAGLLFFSHDKCLWRSLAVAAHLVAAGISAEFVFGVRLRPFEAHSWVQSGSAAVNDRVENVRTFTPILVV